MARTPGAFCLIDVRSTAICQDYTICTNPCAPGAAEAQARRRHFGGCYLLDNCQPPACGFDRPKDMASAFGAFVIVATCLGIVQTLGRFTWVALKTYPGVGYLEFYLITSLTYLVALLSACVAFPIIEYAGHKLTALFGMTFVFIGVLLDSQVFHVAVIYIGNIVFVGIGTGLAYAASATLPADLFRAKLTTALLLVNIGGSAGTIFYTWLIELIVGDLGYKWTKIVMSILVLFFTLGVHVFPKTRLLYASNCEATPDGKAAAIRECVYKAAQQEHKEPCEENKNWLCVCVCDLRLYGDRSFLLFASLVMVATMNLHLPYLFMYLFASSVGAEISPWYITFYCVGSIATRAAFVKSPDFTFCTCRVLFMSAMLASGTMWILLCWTETFGWILVCSLVLGLLEGLICVVTPRLAVATIPRRWLGGAWLTCILLHALGMFIMTIFTTAVGWRADHLYVPFISSGVMQLIVAFLAILLPNEEDEGSRDNLGTGSGPSSNVTTNSMSPKGPCGGGRIDVDYFRSTYGSRPCGQSTPTTSMPRQTTDYRCKCPICQRIGCIPGCLPQVCAPKGSLDC